jgi:type IV pilus assembly protein PilE
MLRNRLEAEIGVRAVPTGSAVLLDAKRGRHYSSNVQPNRGKQRVKKNRGFTLIELMIVVAVLAIIAAIALPSYLNQVRKSRRSAIEGYMQQIALMEERYRADCWTYSGSFGTYSCPAASGGVSGPLGTNPYAPTTAYYTITFVSGQDTATTYKFQAVAASTGGQNKDRAYDGQDCSTLTYDFGVTTAGVVTKGPATCWSQ